MFQKLLKKYRDENTDKDLQIHLSLLLLAYKRNIYKYIIPNSYKTDNWNEILFIKFKELDVSHDLIQFYIDFRILYQYKYDIPTEFNLLFENLFKISSSLKQKLTFEELETKFNKNNIKIVDNYFENIKSCSNLDLIQWIFSNPKEIELKIYVKYLKPKISIYIESRKYLLHIKELETIFNKMLPNEISEKDVLLLYKEKMNDPKVNLICKRLEVERKKIQVQFQKEDQIVIEFLQECIKKSTEILIHCEKL